MSLSVLSFHLLKHPLLLSQNTPHGKGREGRGGRIYLSGGTVSVLLLCRLCIFLKTLKHNTLNMNPVAQQIPVWLLAQAWGHRAVGSAQLGTWLAGIIAAGPEHLQVPFVSQYTRRENFEWEIGAHRCPGWAGISQVSLCRKWQSAGCHQSWGMACPGKEQGDIQRGLSMWCVTLGKWDPVFLFSRNLLCKAKLRERKKKETCKHF